MRSPVLLALVFGAAGAFIPSLASAHVRLVYPTPRYETPMRDSGQDIKSPPCGREGDSRTTDMSRVTVLEPGATIMVRFMETIQHPGHFRVAFDDDGQDAFVTPLQRSMVQTGPTFTLPVLLDNIADQGGMNGIEYMVPVTLPEMSCERCTLQLIQVMTTADSWTEADIYYTCADIALRPGGGMGGAGGMPSGGGSGGAAGGAGIPVAGGGVGGAVSGGAGGAAPGGSGGLGQGGTAGSSGAPSGGVGTAGASGGAPPATGGVPATGGAAPAAGTTSAGSPAGGGAPTPLAESAEEGGCTVAPPRSSGRGLLVVSMLAALYAIRRRGSRSSWA